MPQKPCNWYRYQRHTLRLSSASSESKDATYAMGGPRYCLPRSDMFVLASAEHWPRVITNSGSGLEHQNCWIPLGIPVMLKMPRRHIDLIVSLLLLFLSLFHYFHLNRLGLGKLQHWKPVMCKGTPWLEGWRCTGFASLSPSIDI